MARDGRTTAFTLTELLVVMAIIAVLLGACLPALRGTFDGINLTGSVDNVTASFALARQTAMARNLAVEVRLYNRDSGAGRKDWNTIALLIPALVSGQSADEWLGTPQSLSGTIIMDPGQSSRGGTGADSVDFSSLISRANDTAPDKDHPTRIAPWKATEGDAAPSVLRRLGYVAFRFQPDGSTNLPEQDAAGQQRLRWCLSLRSFNAKKPSDGVTPAANFSALVLDPGTGRVLNFRP